MKLEMQWLHVAKKQKQLIGKMKIHEAKCLRSSQASNMFTTRGFTMGQSVKQIYLRSQPQSVFAIILFQI